MSTNIHPPDHVHVTTTSPQQRATVSTLFSWHSGHEHTPVGNGGHPQYTKRKKLGVARVRHNHDRLHRVHRVRNLNKKQRAHSVEVSRILIRFRFIRVPPKNSSKKRSAAAKKAVSIQVVRRKQNLTVQKVQNTMIAPQPQNVQDVPAATQRQDPISRRVQKPVLAPKAQVTDGGYSSCATETKSSSASCSEDDQ